MEKKKDCKNCGDWITNNKCNILCNQNYIRETEKLQADLSQVKKANELLSERLTEAAHNYWKKCEQLREAEKVIESTSSMLLTWFGEQKVFKDFSERAREYQRKYKRE